MYFTLTYAAVPTPFDSTYQLSQRNTRKLLLLRRSRLVAEEDDRVHLQRLERSGPALLFSERRVIFRSKRIIGLQPLQRGRTQTMLKMLPGLFPRQDRRDDAEKGLVHCVAVNTSVTIANDLGIEQH